MGRESRLGVIITRKVDKRAARRNRLRRRLREIFRTERHKLTKKVDLVIIARKDAADCRFARIKQEVIGALSRAGYIEVA